MYAKRRIDRPAGIASTAFPTQPFVTLSKSVSSSESPTAMATFSPPAFHKKYSLRRGGKGRLLFVPTSRRLVKTNEMARKNTRDSAANPHVPYPTLATPTCKLYTLNNRRSSSPGWFRESPTDGDRIIITSLYCYAGFFPTAARGVKGCSIGLTGCTLTQIWSVLICWSGCTFTHRRTVLCMWNKYAQICRGMHRSGASLLGGLLTSLTPYHWPLFRYLRWSAVARGQLENRCVIIITVVIFAQSYSIVQFVF